MPLYLIGYLIPVVMAVLAVPVVLGKVPPNPIYGFRTPKTLSSPGIWYAANRIAGWMLIGAAAVTTCFNLVLSSIEPAWPPEKLLGWMAGAGAVSVIFASILSLLYLRKL
jgi:hypothetical protein